ncbi:MAG: AAA family ATPase [Thiobacillus sp.]|nr:AAA family ATPase [Thiobacillus sp.]
MKDLFLTVRSTALPQAHVLVGFLLALGNLSQVYGGGRSFASAEGILTVLVSGLAIVLFVFSGQLSQTQSYLSRAAWVFISAVPVWIAWDLYPFYAEAVAHDIVVKQAGEGAMFRPNETPEWYSVALGAYFALSAVLVANLAFAVYVSFFILFREVSEGILDMGGFDPKKNGVAVFEIVRDTFGKKQPEPAPSPVQSSSYKDLVTRDTEALPARFTFDDLAGQEGLKTKLWDAAQEWNNGGKKNGRNGIFLHGVPGTGKTAFAEALAGEVSLRIMKVNVGSIASRWVNQTTEQLQDIIDSALRQAPCVLFLDEVEAIFPDRSRIERGDSEESKVVGGFLTSIEKLRAGKVLLVAATNHKDRVDAAVIREGRFDFHVEVTVPDFEARKGLVVNTLKKGGKTVDPVVLDRLSRRWAGFNVPRIQEATRRAAGFATTNVVSMNDFMSGLRDVQGNNSGVSENAPGLPDLYFDDDLKTRLETLAATFARSYEIEATGASIPKGVAFYGPPGTGKTAMAQALAKSSGWTFISTNGKEILSDPKKLAEIRRKASDLRPAIVFIDEADDILGDRRMSGLKLHTNELLATIDGAGEPLPDVVWIIATNDVDSLDDAVIRRFPVKIELPVPSVEVLTRMIHDWAAKRADIIHGEVEEWSSKVAQALDGLSPSVVMGTLDSALNSEAAASVLRGEAMSITLEEVLKARREMRA